METPGYVIYLVVEQPTGQVLYVEEELSAAQKQASTLNKTAQDSTFKVVPYYLGKQLAVYTQE